MTENSAPAGRGPQQRQFGQIWNGFLTKVDASWVGATLRKELPTSGSPTVETLKTLWLIYLKKKSR